MRSAKTIGVLTFHRCVNYGSYWQARCLVEGLRAQGHDAVLLDHQCAQVNRAELHCALQPTLPQRTPRPALGAYKSKVRRFRSAFDRLPTSEPFPLERPEAAGRYDAVVVGSDEVWNFCHPWYADKPIFFGERLQADRLVSYAASFGNHDAEQGLRADRASQLGQFDALSVRDDNSHRLLAPSVERNIELVLDPCLQFAQHAARPAATVGEYALIYGHGFPEWMQSAVQRWGRRNGRRLVSVGYANEWADEQRVDAGPEEFAALMGGARAVVTNFFHGCVFSLIGGKPFIASRTDYRANKVRDLLAQLAARERLVEQSTDERLFDDLLARPPGTETQETLRDHRHRSQAFLDAALA